MRLGPTCRSFGSILLTVAFTGRNRFMRSMSRDRLKCRIKLHQRHSRWQENGRVFTAFDPRVHDVGPLLHHVATLSLVLCLVVDTARRTAIFMRQALLDPVAVE